MWHFVTTVDIATAKNIISLMGKWQASATAGKNNFLKAKTQKS